jgi:competence protein ComEC
MRLTAYPILRLVIFLILGILLYEYFTLTFEIISIVSLCSILLFGVGLYWKKNLLNSLGIYISIIALGWLSSYISSPKSNNILGKNYEAYLVRINSATENKPKSYKTIGQIYKIKVDSVWHDISTPAQILLYFSKEDNKPTYGDIYLISESPRDIEGPKNPLEFDYKTFQRRRGINQHHFLRKGDFEKVGYKPKSKIFKWSYALNEMAGEKLNTLISNKANRAVAEAMLSGSKDDLDNEVREAYATAGAIHILAVSGLHVGILFIMINFIFGFLNKHKKTKWLYAVLTISCLWAYALFTGLSPSVTRATLMFSLFQLGTMLDRDKNSINTLAASAFILLCINPNWLFEVGFQLSYLAIFGILYLYPYLNELYQSKNWLLTNLWQISMISIAAQLFTVPLSIYYFHQFPSYFLITNPIVTVLSMGVLFFGIPSLLFSWVPYLSDILTGLLDITLNILNKSIFAISALPNSRLSGFSVSSFEVILLYFFVFLILLFLIKREPKFLFTGLFIFCSLAFWNIRQDWSQEKQKEITFHFIPRSSGFSLIDSKSAVFITDSATANKDRAYNFHLKNYYDDKGVVKYTTEIASTKSNILFFDVGNEKYLWVKKYFKGKIRDDFSIILISNNAVYNFERQFEKYPNEVILDDTNSKSRISSLKNQADSLGIKLVSLYETGGITYSL